MAVDDRSSDSQVNASLSKSPAPSVHGPSSSTRGTLMRDPSSSSSRCSQRSGSSDEVSPTTWVNRRLKQPKTFYPLHYGRRLRDMEVWDNNFVEVASGHPTFTPPEHLPPEPVMLDLGCGYGYWCILAARCFRDCHIVGLDIADIQPDLGRLGHDAIAEKITWVHGDILEDLPFPDDHFDLVRSLHIEFCVPETKWGKLLQEIGRVLKPGGIFETAQEALTFPCPRYPPRIKPPRNIAAMKAEGDDGRFGVSKELADTDPRDHSRLKAAFDAMVEVRFLNAQIISTLPFYMELQFDNLQMTPTFHVMLPPSSFVRDRDEAAMGNAAEPKFLADQQISVPGMLRMDPHATNMEVTSDLGGQMHLNQTMNIVLSCKEAIWEQFEVLNRTLTRNDFNFLLKNWELDMRDRIDMRSTLKAGLNWEVPLGEEDPDWRSWREETLKFHEEDGFWDLPLPQPCRSIRAFRGVKNKS